MGEERWMLHTKRADFERIGKQFSVSPVVARIIRNRDVESDEDIRRYLSGGLSEHGWRKFPCRAEYRQ